MASLPEVPIVRLLLYLNRALLEEALRRYVDELAATEEVGVLLYEGSFHLAKASMVWERDGEDVAVCGIHCAPLSDGLIIDGPPSAVHTNAIAARLVTFWDAIKGYYPAGQTLARIIFHDAGPSITGTDGKTIGAGPGLPPANPALRTTEVGSPGTSATTIFLPPQVAISVTMKTAARRQWGRIYLPAGDAGMLNDGDTHAEGIGQIDHDHVIAIRTAAGVLLDGLSDDGNPLVVFSAKHAHALSVDSVQVDSLFDVVRSRRFDRAKWFETHTLTP